MKVDGALKQEYEEMKMKKHCSWMILEIKGGLIVADEKRGCKYSPDAGKEVSKEVFGEFKNELLKFKEARYGLFDFRTADKKAKIALIHW